MVKAYSYYAVLLLNSYHTGEATTVIVHSSVAQKALLYSYKIDSSRTVHSAQCNTVDKINLQYMLYVRQLSKIKPDKNIKAIKKCNYVQISTIVTTVHSLLHNHPAVEFLIRGMERYFPCEVQISSALLSLCCYHNRTCQRRCMIRHRSIEY